ncbi:MAG TPA: lantibiotic dehydratase, partial [Bacteroidia bacterium]|nr:lantibiotic dehydratase [Bacteroidia bacterium]
MNNLRFHDKIVVRIPSLPVTSSEAPDLLDIFLKDKFLSEALFLASPDLHAECARLFNDPDHFSKKDVVRITQSLLKYYLRMKTRCTPFGLFAGCGCITWGTENIISVEPGYNRYTRLDMHFQGALSEYLSQQTNLKNNLLFYPNNSLYILHDKLRYIEYFYLEKRKEFKISSVDNSEILEKILQISKNGVLLKDLASSITNDEITFEEAFLFVNELTDEQILVSEFFPGVTGTDNFEIFKSRIEGLAGKNDSMQELSEILSKISKSVKKLDDKILNETEEYENIIKTISHFNIPTDKNKLFQVDLMRETKGTIERSIAHKIVEIIDLLKPFSINNKNQSLEKFKEKFSERYEAKEICLPFVLDNETGLGYNRHTSESGADNILVDDLFLPVVGGSSQIEEKDRILLSFLIEALN